MFICAHMLLYASIHLYVYMGVFSLTFVSHPISQEHCGPLCDFLCKYYNVFPGKLPKRVPPDRKMGDMHSMPLEPGMEPVRKGLYCHNPLEQLLVK